MNPTYQFLYLDRSDITASNPFAEFDADDDCIQAHDAEVIELAKNHASQEQLSGDIVIVQINGGSVERIVARVKRGQPKPIEYDTEVTVY